MANETNWIFLSWAVLHFWLRSQDSLSIVCSHQIISHFLIVFLKINSIFMFVWFFFRGHDSFLLPNKWSLALKRVSRETLVHHYVQLLCATVRPSAAQLLIVIVCWLSEWMSAKNVLMIQRKCLKFSLLGRSFSFTDSPDRNTDKHIISLSTLAHPNYAFYSHSANAFWEKMAACLCLYVISALIFPVGF